MTRDEYLRILQSNLVNVPPEEVWNIMQYYREYFEDAGEENAAKVMEELGPPEQLARKVSADFVSGGFAMPGNSFKKPQKEKKNYTWLIIILAVLLSPVWFGVLITVISLLFSAVVVIASLLFAAATAGISLIGAGIITFGTGIVTLFDSVATGVMLIGAGMMSVGFGILFVLLLCWLVSLAKKLVMWIKRKLAERKQKKEVNF
ncbi:MAG: DUF1700 domain-containing protein [Lachnospira sp.]|nr:DUF1700 domain-containing protein [Lachnospira sp.]